MNLRVFNAIQIKYSNQYTLIIFIDGNKIVHNIHNPVTSLSGLSFASPDLKCI